jgi:hypothetical protein
VGEATHGDSFDAESFITPELQSKFTEVFGGKEHEADTEAKAPPARASDARQQRRPNPISRLRRRPTEEDETDDEELQQDEPQQRSKPATDDAATDDGQQQTEPQPKPQSKPKEGEADEAQQLLATLNPALRHAAKRTGWSDEEIVEAVRSNPELAERQFARLHASLNDLSARFAMAGRQAQQQQQMPGQQPQQQQQRQMDPSSLLASLFGNDFSARMGERYGETFVDDVLKPLHEHVLQPFVQMQQFVIAQQQAAIAQEVTNAMVPLLDELPDFYGASKGQISNEQALNRQQVLQLADQIRTGSLIQGQPMSLADAIHHAHLMAASDHLQTIERKKLTQQVQKRSRGITARPSQRQTPPRPGQPGAERSEKNAVEAVGQAMAELGLD